MTFYRFSAGSLLFAVAALLYGAFWRLYCSSIKDFPGPRMAALTHWYEFFFDICKPGGGQYIWQIERMHKAYGPIVRISPSELHISDFSFYDQIYAGNHRRRDKYSWQVKSGNSARAMGFTTDHSLHRLRRGAVEAYFSKRNVSNQEGAIHSKIQELLKQIDKYSETDRPLSLTNILLATTTDIITNYAFSDCYNLLENEHLAGKWNQTIEGVMKSTALINHFGWLPALVELLPSRLSNLFAPDMTLIFDYKSRIAAQISNLKTIAPHPPEIAQASQGVFTELLTNSSLPPEEKSLERLTDEGAILVIAASETPAKILALILFHLSQEPRKLQSLRTEIQTMRVAAPTSGGTFSLAQLEKLPYLSAVIKEGLRLHGGIIARSQRIAPTETLHYGKWVVPAGTPLSSSSYFAHYNEEVFPLPRTFTPERWLVDDAEMLNRHLVAFGKGTRNCVGMNLGMAELYHLLAAVVMKFDFVAFETGVEDVQIERDWYVPHGKLDSQGVRVLVKGFPKANCV